MAVKKSFQDIADGVGLTKIDTEEAINFIKHDLLLKTYRVNPKDAFEEELNGKIEELYRQWYNTDISMDDDGFFSPYYLEGPPGQGKTTAYRAAAKQVAEGLGLKYKEKVESVKVVSFKDVREFPHVKFPLDEMTQLLNRESNKPVVSVDEKFQIELGSDDKVTVKNLKTGAVKPLVSSKDKDSGAQLAASDLYERMDMSTALDISRKDFLFVVLECSGENSNITFGGLPTTIETEGPDGKKVKYMSKVPNVNMALLSHVAGGVLLLDDFSNAAPNVQNVALSLALEGKFQDVTLGNSYVGFTGNLGAIDGTYTTDLSTALKGRCAVFFVTDTLDNYNGRLLSRYKDEISDCGVAGFLKRNPELFSEIPDKKKRSGFPAPRNWDKFVFAARNDIKMCGGKGKGELKALPFIEKHANSFVGKEVGAKLKAYYYSMVTGADPIARQIIIDGKDIKKEMEQKYGAGTANEQQSFGYDFATAVSDYAVSQISKDKKNFNKVIERLGAALCYLNKPEFAFAIDYFANKLAAQVDEYADPESKKRARRVLTIDMKRQIGVIISETPDYTNEHREALIECLSDYNKLESATRSSRQSRVNR